MYFVEKDIKRYKGRINELAFSDFLFSIFKKEYKDENISIEYHNAESRHRFDFLFEKGFKPYTETTTAVEVLLYSDIEFIKKHIDKLKSDVQIPICVICAISKDYIKDGYIILGSPFLIKMVKKHPELWWRFASSYDENATVKLSTDGRYAVLDSKALREKFGFNCKIDLRKIDDISKVNQNEFLYLIKDKHKSPAIFVGNGVSIPFGSDPWKVLASNVFDYLSPYYIDNPDYIKHVIGDSTYSLTSLPEKTIPPELFRHAIKNSIYRKYIKKLMHIDSTLLHSIVKAKHNHIDMPLITYNYDCFIEDDFELYFPHFSLNVVHDEETFSRFNEPKINHVHGYIPNSSFDDFSNVILTDDEYFNAYNKNNEGWVPKIQRLCLEQNICLFVGSSLSDVFQMSLIDDARSKALSRDDYRLNNWKCFALMCFKNLSPKDKLTIINYYLRKGIFVIFKDDYSQLPATLDSLMDF